MKPSTPATLRLASRRQELESRLDDLRHALDREIGWVPAARTWILPLTAFATGVALAAWLVARRGKD